MKEIFIDTGALSAIADSSDVNHEIALAHRDEISGKCRLIVTNYVLDELYTLMLINQGYQHTVDFKRKLDVMIRGNVLEVVWVSEYLSRRGLEDFLEIQYRQILVLYRLRFVRRYETA